MHAGRKNLKSQPLRSMHGTTTTLLWVDTSIIDSQKMVRIAWKSGAVHPPPDCWVSTLKAMHMESHPSLSVRYVSMCIHYNIQTSKSCAFRERCITSEYECVALFSFLLSDED